MQKRGAVELSINMLVVIIISLVILGAGVTLLYKFISGAEEIKAQLDERTKAELERLLIDQGKKVALPLHIATVPRGEPHVFGIGILNIDEEHTQYQIEVTLDKVVDENNQPISPIYEAERHRKVQEWTLYDQSLMTIQTGEHQQQAILVNLPKDAAKGTYIFSAKVTNEEGQQYGNVQQFYVNAR